MTRTLVKYSIPAVVVAVALTVGGSIAATQHRSSHADGLAAQVSSSAGPMPPLASVGQASAQGSAAAGYSYAPPQNSASAMPAAQAEQSAWTAMPPETQPTSVDAVLAYATGPTVGNPSSSNDAWLITYRGTCYTFDGPTNKAGAPASSSSPCVVEPQTVAIDAQTGAFLFSVVASGPVVSQTTALSAP